MFKQKAALYCLSLSALALGISSYMTAGLIPLMSADFAISVSWAAQSVAAFTFAYGLLAPIAVGLTGKRSLRANILLYLAIFVLANAVSAAVPQFWLFLLSRAVEGIAAGAFLANSIGASAQLSAAAKQGKSISVIMAGMAIGTVLGVPLSLFVAQHYSWRGSLVLVCLIGALAWAGLALLLPPLAAKAPQHHSSRFKLLADMRLLRILLISLFIAIASLGMYTFLAPFVQAVQAGSPVTLYLWFWGIGGIAGSIAVGYCVDAMAAKKILLIILAALIIVFTLMPYLAAVNLLWLILPLIFWGAAGWALQVPQNNELLKLRKPLGDGNLAVGLNQSSVYLGGALGSVFGGLMLSGGISALRLPLIFIIPLLLALILVCLPAGRKESDGGI